MKRAPLSIDSPTQSPARRVLSLLIGSWDVARQTTPGGTFLGSAFFTPISPTNLRFVERGEHHLDPVPRAPDATPNAAPDATDRNNAPPQDICAKRVCLSASRAGTYFIDPADHALVISRNHPTAGPVELHRLYFSAEILTAEHTHLCASDSYHTVFRVEPDLLVVHYRVRGPSKSFDSRAEYRRRPLTREPAHASAPTMKH